MTFDPSPLRRLAWLAVVGVLAGILTTGAFALPAQEPLPVPEVVPLPAVEQPELDPFLSEKDLVYLSIPSAREELAARYRAYAGENPQLEPEAVVLWVNMGLDRDFYTDVQTVAEPSGLTVLVNKYNALPADYEPALVALSSALGGGSLRAEAAEAFSAMAADAGAEGVRLRSVSAYRSYSTQTVLFARYVAQSGETRAETFSARAGYSEHQTGLALDINTARISAHFENTQTYAWLVENCAQYGFILRYPAGKQTITGYSFEPWHYRYVGVEIAKVCMERGLTYEEYLAGQPETPSAPALERPSLWVAQSITPSGIAAGDGGIFYTVALGDTLRTVATDVFADAARD